MIKLCDRWHKLPSEILAEPVYMLQMIALEALVRRKPDEPAAAPAPEPISGWTLAGEPVARQTNNGPAVAPAEALD